MNDQQEQVMETILTDLQMVCRWTGPLSGDIGPHREAINATVGGAIEKLSRLLREKAQTIPQQLGSAAPPMKFYQLPVGAKFVWVTNGVPHNEVNMKKGPTTWGGFDTCGEVRRFQREEDWQGVMIVED